MTAPNTSTRGGKQRPLDESPIPMGATVRADGVTVQNANGDRIGKLDTKGNIVLDEGALEEAQSEAERAERLNAAEKARRASETGNAPAGTADGADTDQPT